jgi:hypothetical protein
MAKRRSKARGKASAKSRQKTKKPMTAATAKPATRRKTRKAKSRRKVTGKAATKRGRKTAAMQAKPIIIPVKAGANKPGVARKTGPANPLGINLPAMPFPYSRDSVMNVLVGMLILFAVVSAGIFYPQTTTTEQALTAAAPGMMQKK